MSDLKFVYIDFEYNSSCNEFLNLVCASYQCTGETKPTSVWLHNEQEAKDSLSNTLKELSKDHIFVVWSATAEGRSFLSLGLDPSKMKFLDLQAEYKMLINHNNEYRFGKQLGKTGHIINTICPSNKWTMTKKQLLGARFDRPLSNLASACFKLLGEKIDTDNKTKMRDLIIENKPLYLEQERIDILRYCESDIKLLPALQTKLFNVLKESTSLYLEESLFRGKAVCHHAIMENVGYPINYEKTKSFSNARQAILNECCRDINSLFPEIIAFHWSKKLQRFMMKTKNIKGWISSQGFDNWAKTATGDYSLALDAFTEHFKARHHFRDDCFGEQMVRFLKLKQSLNGFQETKKGSFWDNVGSDKRVRPYLNSYGSQSARTQPKATSFLFLKPAWQRSLVQAKHGNLIGTIDYGSVEFLISALLSNDRAMIEAYKSGDVYLHFAKAIGLVPKDGTKAEYQLQRDICKACVLGISYGLTKFGLATDLAKIMGTEEDLDYAQELIDLFFDTYPDYRDYRYSVLDAYHTSGSIKLIDGWTMFGDNPNDRSVQNCPVQGMGSVILRKAIIKAHARDMIVIFPLHDALYIEFNQKDIKQMDHLYTLMKDAFVECFPGQEEDASLIRLDGKVWGRTIKQKGVIDLSNFTVDKAPIHIDDRAKEEYEKFKGYLDSTLQLAI